MEQFKLKAEVVFNDTLNKLKLRMKYVNAPRIEPDVLYVLAKQASVHSVNQLINEHTTKSPSRFNIERHNYWVKVLHQLEKNF